MERNSAIVKDIERLDAGITAIARVIEAAKTIDDLKDVPDALQVFKGEIDVFLLRNFKIDLPVIIPKAVEEVVPKASVTTGTPIIPFTITNPFAK